MNHILNEFWHGNIEPCVDCRPDTPEAKDLSMYITRHKKELASTLNDSQLEMLEKLESCVDEYVNLQEKAIFEYAYSLAWRTAIEVFTKQFDAS